MFKYLLLITGTAQIIIALAEFISPLRSFRTWKLWVMQKYFPIHGFGLILIGMPLTQYQGFLSSVIFYIALFIVFSGPFIMIYPEKIRAIFINDGELFKEKEIKVMIFIDALFRFSVGIIFWISCWKTFL